MLITEIQDLGGMGYLVFASLMIFLQAPPPRPLPSPRHLPPRSCCADCVAQVVPIAAAFILTVSAGAIFGGVKGTAMVLTCSTISASISFGVSRSFGRQLVLEAAQESPQCAALPGPPPPPGTHTRSGTHSVSQFINYQSVN